MQETKVRLIAFVALAVTGALLVSCKSNPNAPASDPVLYVDETLVRDYRTEWLADKAIKFRTVDPSDIEFSDLQPLKRAIGESRIVMLGEQSHGDGTTFLAKTRLIKFLHREMGFDVLAFESGLYDCHKAWEFLRMGETPVVAVRRGVFTIWTYSNEVQPLIDYLGETVTSIRPLELAGFDCQFTGTASRDFLITDLTQFLTEMRSSFHSQSDWPAFRGTLDSLIRGFFWTAKPAQVQQSAFSSKLGALSSEIDSLVRLNPSSKGSFWNQLVKSIKAQALSTWNYDLQNPTVESGNTRDEQMGDNLLWLSRNCYPDRKIIVWAATYHVMHNQSQINTMTASLSYSGLSTMGHVVWQSLGDDVYVLGFTAYEGSAGSCFQTPRDIGKAGKESLENLMRSAGLQNAMVDFRNLPSSGDWMRQKIVSRPLGYSPMLANWTIILDGMMFTRVMSPSTTATR